MDDIRKWYNGKKNYAEGVQLYLKYGNDAQLIRLFTHEAQSDFKQKKLISALDELLSAASPNKQPAPVPKKTITDVAIKHMNRKVIADITDTPPPEKRWPEKRDAVVQSLWEKWKPVFSEMMNLMARVGAVAREGKSDPYKEIEAGKMALRILDLDDECDTIYHNRDFYITNGKMPLEEKPVEISLDPLLWPKKLENHSRYARRFKRELEKDPANIEKAELLQKHEWAVSEYKKRLKMK